MNNFLKGTAIFTLSTGVLLSSFPISHYNEVAKATTTDSIEQVLAKLTPEQRQALNQLQASSEEGLQLPSSVDLKSSNNLSVIVELKDKPAKVAVLEEAANGNDLSLSDAEQQVNEAQETFKSDLQTIFKDDLKENKKLFKIKRTYKSSLNGVSIELPANKVKSLLQSKEVKAVWPNKVIKVEPSTIAEGTSDSKKIATEVFPGINKLHDEGITGKGIKVGVIDTGIDYNHPDLTDAYKGYRAQPGVDPKSISPSSVKGWDFVDNDADPMETTYDDWKKSGLAEVDSLSGSTYYTEHGTHVSGIIAGRGKNNTDYAVTGVAPDADLYVYRVLGKYGSGNTENVLGGIDKSVADGMDVINLSLGADYNDPTDVESIAVNNAVLSGVTAVVAAGNAGDGGNYTLGEPGAAALAITVGANDTKTEIATSKATLHGTTEVPADLKLLGKGFSDKIDTLKGLNLPMVFIPGTGADANYNGKDVNGKIVLVNRGTTAIADKIKVAGQHGAKAVIIINSNVGEGFIPTYLGNGYGMIPAFSVSNEQGTVMQSNTTGTSTFSFDEVGQVTDQGSKLASFSSRGPARITYDIKPEVTAPGVAVFSTVPSYMHGADQIGNYQYAYDNLSGTSMATPNVAGVAALLLQANPNLTPAQIKETLMNTADPLNGNYSVYESGAGQVDPYEAIHAQSRIEVVDETEGTLDKKGNLKSVKDLTGALAFGVQAPAGTNISDQRSLNLYNNDKKAKTFDVNVTFQTGRQGSLDADANGVMIVTDKSIKVGANSKKKSTVAITIPKSAALGTYEGFVTYTNHDNPNETYQVPFAIKTVEEGMNPVTLSPQAFTQVFDSSYAGQLVYTTARFSLKSHMRTIDVILEDGKTNKELGFVGTLDGLRMNENVNLAVSKVFSGFYYASTGDENHPFAYDKDLAKPGYYKLKFVATNDAGRTFIQEAPFYFDNIAPKMTINSPDVVEYTPGQSSVNVTGSVFDKDTEVMKNLGLPFTQASTKLYYQDQFGGSAKQIPLNADGTFSIDIPTNSTRPMLLSFYALDAASNKTFKEGRDIYFVPNNVAYSFLQPEKRIGNMGETVHSTLSLNKVSNVKQAVFKIYHLNDVASLNVKPHPSVADKVDVKLEDTFLGGSTYQATVTVTLKDGIAPLTGNLSLVDVASTFSHTYTAQAAIWQNYLTSVTYTDMNSSTKTVFSSNPSLYMNPTYSLVRGGLDAEAFELYLGDPSNQQPNASYPYSKMGINVKAIGPDGKVYNGTIDSQANTVTYKVPNFPLNDDVYELQFDVPGHFTVHKNFTVGFHDDGKVINQNLFLRNNPAIAGDVNKDDVIDVLDAIYIHTYWGTNKRAADINYDGNVDAKDLAFVEEHYLMQNPTVKDAPTAKKKYKNQTLESVKSALGL
ncbi:S8 family serine peptidase [Gottfriedia sp. NPDC056225]|uniref:S8 family serine peptidase n=1 Tax=Gottfriedia sp. NPDC056225 TaxID=3345751 RepID=UPI0035DA8F3F